MKKTLAIIIFILINSTTWAQDSLLIGKWELKEIWKDSILFFDCDNIDVSFQTIMSNKVKSGKVKTKADSTVVLDFIKDFHTKSKLTFYEFSRNQDFKQSEEKQGGQYVLPEELVFGNVTARSVAQSKDTFIIVEKRGVFETDGLKILITLEGESSDYGCCNFEIKGNLLILNRTNGVNSSTVYRKIKE